MKNDSRTAFNQAESALRQATMSINSNKMTPPPAREPNKAPMGGMKDAIRTLGEQNARRIG